MAMTYFKLNTSKHVTLQSKHTRQSLCNHLSLSLVYFSNVGVCSLSAHHFLHLKYWSPNTDWWSKVVLTKGKGLQHRCCQGSVCKQILAVSWDIQGGGCIVISPLGMLSPFSSSFSGTPLQSVLGVPNGRWRDSKEMKGHVLYQSLLL